MRSSYVATLGVASLFALGCADSSSNVPTDPGLTIRSALTTADACTSTASRVAKAELETLLNGASLKEAQRLWRSVEGSCSIASKDNANGALMTYVGYLRSLYPAGFIPAGTPATKESKFLGHVQTAFLYVGYDAPVIQDGSTGPLQAGIFAVIPARGGQREFQRAKLGAFRLDSQFVTGDQRGHLFIMYPLSSDCLSVDNLEESGARVQLSAFPSIAPKFDPVIKVGVCSPEGTNFAAGHVLGHETGGKTEIAGESAYPSDCHDTILGSSVVFASSPLQSVMTRLASVGRSTFGIRPAYATDKGLGGIGSTLSPWAGVNALIFAANFAVPPNTLNAPPADVGTNDFYYDFASPGSILIKNSLGNVSGGLVVLSQGGGACTNCGGLYLRANFHSTSQNAADDGIYTVSWTSVQASPGVKGAPFVIRSSDSLEIARLTYSTVSSKNYLSYNGDPIAGRTWVRNRGQTFTITVNLNTKKTSLKIGTATVLTDKPFVDAGALDLDSFAAEFSGIDSGVMGLDEIGVQRRSDR